MLPILGVCENPDLDEGFVEEMRIEGVSCLLSLRHEHGMSRALYHRIQLVPGLELVDDGTRRLLARRTSYRWAYPVKTSTET